VLAFRYSLVGPVVIFGSHVGSETLLAIPPRFPARFGHDGLTYGDEV
jgi:hypothetical protein